MSRKWNQLSQEDRNEVVCKAFEWRQDHARHVEELKTEASGAWYAPTGAELLKPQLWRAPHWVWFDRGGE